MFDKDDNWKWIVGILIMLFITLGGGTLSTSIVNTKIHENHEQRIIFLEKQTTENLENIFEELENINSKIRPINCKIGGF